MSYLQRSRKSSHRKHLLIIGAILLGGWILFSLLGGAIVSTISPIWRSENAVSRLIASGFTSLKLHSTLVAENEALQARIDSLDLELADTRLALSQARSLEETLGRARRVGETVASVLTRPPQSPYDLFVIDAGLEDGLAEGALVSLPEGPLLGRVSDLSARSAKVKLFSSSGEKTSAVLERGRVPVELEGLGGGSFKIIVPRETVTVAGDRVLSSDTAGNLLAVVEGMETGPTDSFKEILARSPANIFSVRLVSISK
jgi:cell shape-determining protein MreC